MNIAIKSITHWARALAAVLGLFAATASLQAQTYVWNVNANGFWTTITNWNPSIGYPNGAGVVADLSQLNISGGRTVTLDAGVTLGTLLIGDTDNTHGYTITTTNASIITFDSGSSAAAILKNTAGATNTPVRVGFSLLSDLVVSNESAASSTTGYLDLGASSGGPFVISAGSAGLKTVTFSNASLKRINVYSSIQDGDGQVGVVAALYNPALPTQALNLLTENTFTGGLTVSGRLVSGNGLVDKALGGSSNHIYMDGGTLAFGGITVTTSQTNDNTVTHAITLLSSGGAFENSSVDADKNPLAVTIATAIDGTGALTKTGTSSIILTGNNTYTGGTVINAGTLSIGADANLGASGTSVTMNGGTLSITTGLNVSTSERQLIMNATGTISVAAFTNWYGSVSGTGLLVKSGGSTFSLNNTNSNHTGGFLVTGGTIRFRGGDGAMGAAGNGVTLSNNTTFASIDDLTLGAGRTITLLSGTGNFNINPDRTLTWEGAIVGAGGLNKTNSGTMVLVGQASYTGNTTINAGTLRLGDDNRISSSSALILKGGTLDLDGHSQALATLQILADSTIVIGDGGLNTLVFGDSSAVAWTGGTVLSITGDAVSGQTIRVGSSAAGLTVDQLAQILVNGNAVGIDAGGYLTFIPEPAALAQLLGISALMLVGLRRRSLKR